MEIKELTKDFDHTEDNIKALQSVGQIIGEVLKQLDDERCKYNLVLLLRIGAGTDRL
jgi:ATP-dependent 26S proteasome regulatory subunit